MSTESSFRVLRSPRHQYDLVENPQLLPPTSNHHMSQLNASGHQPGANHAVAYHSPNHAGYGQLAQYRDNLRYEGPPPSAVNFGEPHAHQGNLNDVPYALPGNAQHYLAAPGIPPVGYHIPPAHDMPNDRVRDRPPPIPDVANVFSRSAPESALSRTLATEGLKRLADLYLHDPGSQVDTLRMGLNPSSGRLRVMIVLDIDI